MDEKRWPEHYDDIQGQSPQVDADMRRMFPVQMDRKDQRVCPWCSQPVRGQEEFDDELSWREFLITGCCQACQNAFFGNEEA